MVVKYDEPESIYRSIIIRISLASLQVAAYHILSKGKSLPGKSEYTREVRMKLLEIRTDPDVHDDLVDLQDMRVNADYR